MALFITLKIADTQYVYGYAFDIVVLVQMVYMTFGIIPAFANICRNTHVIYPNSAYGYLKLQIWQQSTPNINMLPLLATW